MKRVSLKTLAEILQNQKNAPNWRSYVYPPEWHRCKGWFTAQALTPVKIWVAAIPTIAIIESIAPVTLSTSELKITLGGEFKAPFNIQLSYLAALSYLFSYFLFQIFCPKFVLQHPAKFDSPPECTTRTDIARAFRETFIKDMPRVSELTTGNTLKKSTYGFFKIRDSSGNKLAFPSEDEAKEAEEILKENANYTSKKLIYGDAFPLRISKSQEILDSFFVSDGYGGFSWKYDRGSLSENAFWAIFAPDIKLRELSEDKNLIATKTFNNLYFTLSESRSIARFFMSMFFYISVAAGLVVLLQIIFRGMRLIW